MKSSRFRMLMCAAVALSALLPATAAYAADKIKVGYLKIPPLVSMIYAMENGLFAKNGLEVDLRVVNGGLELMSALASGSVDIGQTSAGAVVIARGKGLKLKAFGTQDHEAQNDPRNWIVGSQEGGTLSLKDLEGKTVGIVAKNSPAELMVRDHMLHAGADPDKADFVALPFPQLPPALEIGNVQAIMVGEPFYSQIMASEKIKPAELGYGLTATVQDGQRIALGGWFASDEWLADPKNQDIATRFLRTLMESNRTLAADRSLVNAIFEKDFGMPPRVAAKVILPFNTESFVSDAKDYEPLIEAYVRTKMMPKAYPAADVVQLVDYE